MKNKLKEFEWKALEFEKTEKTKSWFIIPGIITIIIGIFALFIFYIYANKDPLTIKFRINEKGIKIGKKFFDFDELKSFWVFYSPPEEKELSIRSKKMFIPYIKIPLGNQNPNEIRKYLLKFLPEKRHKESVVDIWMKRIGF